jgi:integrase
MHPDGRGLYLRISANGARSWILRYALHGRRHDLGLGSADVVSLADARGKAQEARILISTGVDPVGAKHAHTAAARAAATKVLTFKECATAYIAAHRAGWRSVAHATQWGASLRDFVFPAIGALPVASIDTALVIKVLEPIWRVKTETASRVRGRIESVLDWAKVRGYRDGENPARWRGHLDKLLPKPGKVVAVEHHPALPYREMPAFMAALRQRTDAGARALEFLILTAARSGEVVGATPDEFDRQMATWTVPGSRMKSGKEHRVPLSAPALAVVDAVLTRHASADSMSRTLVKLRTGVTAHGFRSTFRDWAAECTDFPSEVVEMALAHVVSNKTEAAYRRGDLFGKRRELMDHWAEFCAAA